MFKKIAILISLVLGGLVIIYLLGPKVTYDEIVISDSTVYSIDEVEGIVDQRENMILDLKEGNRAEIVWAKDVKKKTEFSLVYLHGFSSSHEEGNPVHRNFAERYGCNLFLSRHYDHGRVDTNSFENMTPQDYISSAQFAIDIGKALGEKVILMNCSTGATAALYLAAEDSLIAGIINYSPNIDIYGSMDELLVSPWGKQLAKVTFGGEYNRLEYSEEQAKYWNAQYHIDGLISMKYLINKTMRKETFAKITQPVFLGYYYKNEEEQDKVVSVDRMLEFFDQISTSDTQKRKVAYPNGRHVMSSRVFEMPVTKELEQDTYMFAEEVLGLRVVD